MGMTGVLKNVRVTAMLMGGVSPLGRPSSVAGRTRTFFNTPMTYLFLILFTILGGGCRSTLEYHQPTGLVMDPKNPFDKTISMTKKDRFQAGQWLRLALSMTSVGDYVTAWRYCEYILEYYSDTLYAVEAMKIEDKIANYKRNKAREYMRDNPGLFMGR